MENKPICYISKKGSKIWKLNGRPHRLDGPAVELYHGGEQWWVDGNLHRLDGPAIIKKDGVSEWYIMGIDITFILKEWAVQRNIDLDNLTDVDKALIKITWADYR